MNIIFVAGGKLTRFKYLNLFPKILLNNPITNKSILQSNIELLGKKHNYYLIINEKYYNLTINYIKVNKLNINIIKTDNSNGSYNTIMSVYDLLPNNNILFIWSDIILNNNASKIINLNDYNKNNIIIYKTDYNHYRYNIDENNKILLTSDYKGNIPGIYYFNILEKNNIIDYKYEFLNYINTFNYNSILLPNIKEFKDIYIYKEYIEKNNNIFKNNNCRFFNKLEIIDNNKLLKKCINSNYNNIIRKEINWYLYIKNLYKDEISYLPNIYEIYENSFLMEYFNNYITLYQYRKKTNIDNIILTYNNIFNKLKLLHNISTKNIPYEIMEKDIKYEVFDKVLQRCDSIKNILINYDKNKLLYYLNKVLNHCLEIAKYDMSYVICHGDLNGSNIIVNPENNDIKFIDPRGYFGYTEIYGWKYYEYAKILYSLLGYDDLNNNNYIYSENVNLTIYNKIIEHFEIFNDSIYKELVGIIFISLSSYISLDIMKANIAYDNGIKILKEIYNEA